MPTIKERAGLQYDKELTRRRQAYQLARELGFTVPEARILSGYSQRRILLASKERENGLDRATPEPSDPS